MRVGVNAGPFWVSGNPGPLLGFLFVVGVALAAVRAAVQYWYVTAALVVVLGLIVYVVARWQRSRHEAARHRENEQIRRWLTDPAPPLPLPGRFTQTWLAATVPTLHPGQIEPLLRELRARGWKEDRIEERVAPLTAQNRSNWSRWAAPTNAQARPATTSTGATLSDIFGS